MGLEVMRDPKEKGDVCPQCTSRSQLWLHGMRLPSFCRGSQVPPLHSWICLFACRCLHNFHVCMWQAGEAAGKGPQSHEVFDCSRMSEKELTVVPSLTAVPALVP